MLNGSFISAFATQGVNRLVTDLADQLRHSSLPPYEWLEMTNNIIVATKQDPTAAYLRYIAPLQPDSIQRQKQADAQAACPISVSSSLYFYISSLLSIISAFLRQTGRHDQQQNRDGHCGIDDLGNSTLSQLDTGSSGSRRRNLRHAPIKFRINALALTTPRSTARLRDVCFASAAPESHATALPVLTWTA